MLLNLRFVFCIFAVIASTYGCANELSWTNAGIVTAGSEKITLNMQNVFAAETHRGMLYLVGYKVDSDGQNTPTVAAVSDSLNAHYWSFDVPVNDVFEYDANVHIMTSAGLVYSLENGEWIKDKLNFPKESTVVYSQGSQLIVCYPASLFKEVEQASGCISKKPEWSLPFHWLTVGPAMCGQYLYVLEGGTAAGQRVKKVSIVTGKVLETKAVSEQPVDLCKLHRPSAE